MWRRKKSSPLLLLVVWTRKWSRDCDAIKYISNLHRQVRTRDGNMHLAEQKYGTVGIAPVCVTP